MRLLLDQGLPRSAAAVLRAEGRDVVHVSEVGLAAATDLDILDPWPGRVAALWLPSMPTFTRI